MLLAACATPYQPRGLTGGYSERKLENDVFLVSFSGNGFTSRDTVYRSWLYRCAEITVQQGYDWFAVLGSAPKVSTVTPALDDSPDIQLTKGGGGGGGGHHSAPTYIYYGGGGGGAHFTATATIRMFHGNPGPGIEMAYAAQEVMRDLAAEVKQIASTVRPSGRVYRPEDVFGGPGNTVNPSNNVAARRSVTLEDLKDLLPAAE